MEVLSTAHETMSANANVPLLQVTETANTASFEHWRRIMTGARQKELGELQEKCMKLKTPQKPRINKKGVSEDFPPPSFSPSTEYNGSERSQSARDNHLNHLTTREANSDSPIDKRPLSFDIHHSMNGKMQSLMINKLDRRNSLSEGNVYEDSTNSTDTLDNNKLAEKFASHESVLNLREGLSMLHLIPTSKARQRNFLQGKIGVNSLLGPGELDRVCLNREITIFVGTWNMNGHSPPKELNDFVLPVSMEHVPDILVFGTQESSSEKFEWEVSLQETIGPSHLLFHSASLGTLHLSTFIRRDLIWYVSIPEEASLSVRPGTAFRTKGAVATSFMVFGTSFLFVTAHLTAHQEKVKERVGDVKRIVHSLDLPKTLPCKNKNKGVT
ncbi:hypothetical protein JTB14_026720 [Gonioctena quinquepunctata]|nr:hypothetical protein JTB14_026720 [Gonioctena quinquepunctata]